jgi:protoheme ferro-lyase
LRFDSVLIVSFGGPQGPADIRPFLANVLRGRRVSPERVEEVAHHYELFGGVSPITEVTRRQARGLEQRLAALGHALPVYVGMRNWHPLLPDTLREMYAAGHRHAVGFIAAAQHSYSSCQQYRENVMAARDELRRGGQDVAVTYAGSIIRRGVRRTPNTFERRWRASPSRRAEKPGSCLPRTAFRRRWPSGRGIRSSSTPRRDW